MGRFRARLALSLVLGCAYLAACRARNIPMPASLTPLNGTRRLQQVTGGADYQMFLTDTPTSCVMSPGQPGTITLGKRVVQVPANLVVMFPSQAFVWGDSENIGNCSTLVMNIAANVIKGQIIAGTIDADHLHAVIGTGYIQSFHSGGGMVISDPSAPGTLIDVYLNDPTNAYSDASGTAAGGYMAEPRFAVDPLNQVVLAATGYPMCIASPTNPNCMPNQNRVQQGVNPNPSSNAIDAFYPAFISQNLRGKQNMYQYIVSKYTDRNFDPSKQAAFLVNDYVTYTGYWDAQLGAVRAYSIVAGQLSLMTEPGYEPSYVSFDDAISGTAGQKAAAGAAVEQAIRSRWEGESTDPWRPVSVQAVDYTLTTVTYREYGLIMPDYGPLLGGVQYGRWRFRPPCVNALPDTGNKGCTLPNTQVLTKQKGAGPVNPYYPAPREIAAVPGRPITQNTLQTGDIRSWFQNPTIEYLWAEGIPGSAPSPNTFYDLPYLQGGYANSPGPLTPFPTTALNTDNPQVAGFPTPAKQTQITDLVAAATFCGTSTTGPLQVCAWFTPPAGTSTTELQVFLLPYFSGSSSNNVVVPTQWPPAFDFTLQKNSISTLMQQNTALGPNAWCTQGSSFTNANKPSLPLSVVIRSNANTPTFVSSSFSIPVDKISYLSTCPSGGVTPTKPVLVAPATTNRYGFNAPYTV